MAKYKKSFRSGILLIISLFIFAECNSIFEQRQNCPSLLTIDYSGAGGEIESMRLWLFDGDGLLKFAKVKTAEDFGHLDTFLIEKGLVKCYAWANMGDATDCITKSGSRVMIQKKEMRNPDPLYFFAVEREISKDTARIKILPYSQFTTVEVTFSGLGRGESVIARLITPSSGFYLDGGFIEQTSQTSSVVIDSSRQQLRLLRQNSLRGIMLEVKVLNESGNERDYSFDLGEYLSRINYDMSAVKLEKIEVIVELGGLDAAIRAGNWDYKTDVEVNI